MLIPTIPFFCALEMSILYSCLLVLAASFFCYWSSLGGGFVFDDHRAILTNEDLDSGKTSLWELFHHDFWGGPMSRKESHKSYRPLTVLTFRYFNFCFSGLEPYGYHLANVLLHSLASVLVLLLSHLLLGGRSVQRRTRMEVDSGAKQLRWSTYAAILFAVHSVHTEAVASLVGRAEVLCSIFFLLSLLAYCKGISIGSGSSLLCLRHTKWGYIGASVFFSLCSMLSKEQGVVVIGVCVCLDLALNWEPFWGEFFNLFRTKISGGIKGKNGQSYNCICSSDRKGEQSMSWATEIQRQVVDVQENQNGVDGEQRTNSIPAGIVSVSTKLKRKMARTALSTSRDQFCGDLKEVTKRIMLVGGMGAVMTYFRLSLNNSQPIFKEEELRASFHPDRSVRILSFSNIYSINAWLLLSPSALCCDWSLGSIPLVSSLADWRNVWSLLLYSGIGAVAIHALFSRRDRIVAGVGLVLVVLPFLPASGLIFRVGFVVAERVLYLPSLGLCLLVAAGARRIYHSLHHKCLKMMFLAVLSCHILLLAAKTHARNKDWESDFKIFESGVRVNPLNVKLRNNYGIELKSRGRVEEARMQYDASLTLDPDFGEVYMNMGNLLSDEKNYAEALLYFERGVRMPQMHHKILNNLATTYFRLGRLEEAEVSFKESIQTTPDQPMTYNNLASLYGERKMYKEAEEMFRKALQLKPDYTEAYFNLGTLFIQMRELDRGERYLRKALELQPGHSGAANNLKVIDHYRKHEHEHHLTGSPST